MKFINCLSYLFLSKLAISQGCERIGIRKDLRKFNEQERIAYFSAFRKVMTEEPYRSKFTKMVDSHDNAGKRAHNSAYFFPWHRQFLRELEKLLQQIDSSIMLPYCNWSEYSSNPESSYMFGDNYFGSNGSGANRCVNSGMFRGVTVDYPRRNKCIQRDWNGGSRIGSFPSKATIELTLNKRIPYSRFRSEMEGDIHSVIHVNLGGRSGDMAKMISPNDPFFFCHHTFMDFLWAEWQVRRGAGGNEFGGDGATTSSTLWPWGVKVSETLDTKNPRYCYQYDQHYKGPQVSTKSLKALAAPDKPVEDTSIVSKEETNKSPPSPNPSKLKGVAASSESKNSKNKSNGNNKSNTVVGNSNRRENAKKKILSEMNSTKFIDNQSNDLHEVALMIINGTKNGIRVGPFERDVDPDLIQSTDPLPEEWLTMMGFDIQEQREREAVQEAYVQAHNLIKVSQKPKGSMKIAVENHFQPKESIIESIFKTFTLEDTMHLELNVDGLVDVNLNLPNVVKPVQKTLKGVTNIAENLLDDIL